MALFRFVLLFMLGVVGWAKAAEPPGGVPLGPLVEAVLKHHAGLKALEARVQEAEFGRREIQSRRLPRVSARSTFTRGDHPVYVFGSLMEQGRFGAYNFAIDALNHPGDLSNVKSGLDLGVPLFTGYDLTAASRQSTLAAQEAKQARDGMIQTLRQQALTVFLRLLTTQALLGELDERIAASKEELEEARRLKDRGVVLGSDFYAAQAIYGGMQAWRVQLQGQERSAQAELEILSGGAMPKVQGSLSEAVYPVPSESDARKTAVTRRSDVGAFALRVAQAEERSRQARRSFLPRVEGFVSLETNTHDFGSNPSNHLYGVAAQLPFGDPGYLAKRHRSASGEKAAREVEADARNSATLDVRRAYETYASVVERVPIVKEAAGNAAKSLKLFRPLYRSGRQSILDVLRAEESLARAQASYWQTLGELHAGYVGLMAAMGALEDSVVRDVAARLEGSR